MTYEREEALRLARQFHEAYERLAPKFGYETRTETREFVPESANGQLMVAVCAEVISRAQTQEERQCTHHLSLEQLRKAYEQPAPSGSRET